MAVAIAVSMATIDGLVYYFSHNFINTTFLLASTGAFLVELAAFVGIMLLLSHLVKSTGMLIGIGVGLFILLDMFWSVIVILIALIFRAPLGSLAYYQLSVLMSFINPAQFVSLVNTYLTGQTGFGLITPSQYGITIPTLIGTATLWIAVPFAIYLYLATNRD
jgi:ABC-type transport system involved in multi-copper enzyme maturation permease subunit